MAKHTPPDNRPIGIFDSGVGGLTVLSQVKALFPGESVIYVGDTANAPYGGKTYDELLACARDIITFLRGHNVKAVVLACGTTSSTVYEKLAEENPDLPLVDVIRPGVLACAQIAEGTPLRLGLIATAATIKSGLFARLLSTQAPNIELMTQACPLFAPMVEAGVTNTDIARFVLENYVGKWHGQIDALVLGCTHYPMLSEALTHVLGDIQLINLATHTALALKTCITENPSPTPPTYTYYVSGNPEAFNKTAQFLLGENPNAEKMTSHDID